MDKYTRFFVGVEWICVLASSIASFMFATAIILASAITHEKKNLSFKDLPLRTVIACIVTLIYITLFTAGHRFLVLAILLPLFLTAYQSFTSLALSMVLSILAVVIYTNSAVVWNLALVISVLEERCGVQALRKASQIVKGMQYLHPFLLNLLVMVLSFVLILGFWLIRIKWSSVVQIFLRLVVLNSIYLVRMFVMMAYTVLYYQRKKTHGEEVELQVSTEYNKIQTTLPIDEIIP